MVVTGLGRLVRAAVRGEETQPRFGIDGTDTGELDAEIQWLEFGHTSLGYGEAEFIVITTREWQRPVAGADDLV